MREVTAAPVNRATRTAFNPMCVFVGADALCMRMDIHAGAAFARASNKQRERMGSTQKKRARNLPRSFIQACLNSDASIWRSHQLEYRLA